MGRSVHVHHLRVVLRVHGIMRAQSHGSCPGPSQASQVCPGGLFTEQSHAWNIKRGSLF